MKKLILGLRIFARSVVDDNFEHYRVHFDFHGEKRVTPLFKYDEAMELSRKLGGVTLIDYESARESLQFS